MLAAFVVLPTFALVYLVGAPWMWPWRIVDLAVSGVVLAVVSASWLAVFDLTPPDRRPYAGTTNRNSMLELAVGPYGIGRFIRSAEFRSASLAPTSALVPMTQRAAGEAAPRPRRGLARLFVQEPTGALRLADGQLAAQVGWLLPFALAGIALGAPPDRARGWSSPSRLALLLWAGWLVTYGVVYSGAGGFFHFYYLATMAPPLAALAAVGLVGLCDTLLRSARYAVLLPVAMLLTCAWQLYIDASALGWSLVESHPLHAFLISGALLSAGMLLTVLVARPVDASRPLGRRPRLMAAGAVATGLVAVLLVPGAWALSSVLVPGPGSLPSADLARVIPIAGGPPARTRMVESYDPSGLVAFLEANHAGERYLLATTTTRLAAPIIIGSGHPVMAMGGFHGLDPILNPDKLARRSRPGKFAS